MMPLLALNCLTRNCSTLVDELYLHSELSIQPIFIYGKTPQFHCISTYAGIKLCNFGGTHRYTMKHAVSLTPATNQQPLKHLDVMVGSVVLSVLLAGAHFGLADTLVGARWCLAP